MDLQTLFSKIGQRFEYKKSLGQWFQQQSYNYDSVNKMLETGPSMGFETKRWAYETFKSRLTEISDPEATLLLSYVNRAIGVEGDSDYQFDVASYKLAKYLSNRPPYSCNTNVDPSGVTNFTNAWSNCTSLIYFPLLDVSSGDNFYGTWSGCTSLTSFPLLDVSNGTTFDSAWYNCTSLTSFPALNVSNGANFSYAWYNCNSLTSFPLLDTGSGANFSGAWANCTSLISFPALNVSNGTNFGYAWYHCTSLTSFPLLDVSNGIYFSGAWYACSNLTSFPQLDVSNSTIFLFTWTNCTSLISFPANMFDHCLATNFNWAWYTCGLNQTSVDNILVSLDTAGQNNGVVHINGGTSSPPSTTGLAAKANLIARGWTVYTN